MKYSFFTFLFILVSASSSLVNGQEAPNIIGPFPKKTVKILNSLNIETGDYQNLLKKLEQYAIEFSNLHPKKKKEFYTLLKQAENQYKDKKEAQALQTLWQAQNLFNNSAKLHSFLAACYNKLRITQKALKHAHKALKLDPLNIQFRLNLAELHFFQQEFSLALKQYSLLLKHPDFNQSDLRSYLHYKQMASYFHLAHPTKKITQKQQKNFKSLFLKKSKHFAVNIQNPNILHYYTLAFQSLAKGDSKKTRYWIKTAKELFPTGKLSLCDQALFPELYHYDIISPYLLNLLINKEADRRVKSEE